MLFVASVNDLKKLKAIMLNISPNPELVDLFKWLLDAKIFSVKNVAIRLTSLVFVGSEVDVKIYLNHKLL